MTYGKFKPWETYSNLPDGNELPIDAPPCPDCKYWRPVKMGIGVNLCHYDMETTYGQMEGDFSCFTEKQLDYIS
ncbi:MAG: hypothetical protein ACPG5Z_00305 [Pseudoalteromonas sp.]